MSTSSIALVLVSSIAPITSSSANDAEQQVTQLNRRISHLNEKLSQLSASAVGGDDTTNNIQIQEQKQVIQAQLVALQSQVSILQQVQTIASSPTDTNATKIQGTINAASSGNQLDLYV